ncbi:MAG: hypothetical protein HY782_03580 [Chloroflexi bacterium]|nr:hypothetical protein [Chloroflexota bacterium]
MWTQIVGGMVLLIAASFAIQVVLPRNLRAQPRPSRQYLKRDAAPISGFLGALLLVLSFVESSRQQVIVAWGWGAAVGLVAGLGLWVAMIYWHSQPAPVARPAKRFASLRLAWRIITTYGMILLFALLGLNIAVRIMGASLEVFLAGALGVVVIAMAFVMYASSQ